MNGEGFGDGFDEGHERDGGHDERTAAVAPQNVEARDVNAFETLERAVDTDAGNPGFPRLAEAYRRSGDLDRAEEIAVAGLAEAPERLGGKVALALIMLDKGEIEQAQQALSGILEDVPEVPAPVAEEVEAEREAAVEHTAESANEAPVDSGEGVGVGEEEELPEPQEHRLFAAPLAEPSEVLPRFDGEAAETEPRNQALREDEIEDAFAAAETDIEPVVSPDEIVEEVVRSVEATGTDSDGEPYRPSERPVFATQTMANLLEGQGDAVGAEEVRAALEIPAADPAPASSDNAEAASATSEAEAAVSTNEMDAGVATEPPAEAAIGDENPSRTETAEPVAELVAEPVDAASALDEIDQEVEPPASDPRRERRARVIARLEGWLENLRRDPV